MDKNVTGAARQIMMNDLGLTQEYIREEMIKIITGETKKVLNILISERRLEDIVHEEIVRFTGGPSYPAYRNKI